MAIIIKDDKAVDWERICPTCSDGDDCYINLCKTYECCRLVRLYTHSGKTVSVEDVLCDTCVTKKEICEQNLNDKLPDVLIDIITEYIF